jgi:hypothetical protein
MANDKRPSVVRRIWVPQVAVDVEVLRTRVNAAQARGLDPVHQAVAEGVRLHLERATNAAFRRDPLPTRWANWWRGTLVETAYRHMHAAEVQIIDLYTDRELEAEIPAAVARAQTALHREDVRQWTVDGLRACTPSQLRPELRRINTDSYAAMDAQHGQLRSFRNIVLLAALLVVVLVVATVLVVSQWPRAMPLCFPFERNSVPIEGAFNCPTRTRTGGPTGGDVLVVALLGLLGGALAAAISIRNLKGTTTPYDVPVALSLLKVPLGAFTAILALVAVRAEFVPGLSTLDSQEQILAYALLFGFGQQVFTRLLDQRAQTLLNHLPSKDAADEPPRPPPVTATVPAPTPPSGGLPPPAVPSPAAPLPSAPTPAPAGTAVTP